MSILMFRLNALVSSLVKKSHRHTPAKISSPILIVSSSTVADPIIQYASPNIKAYIKTPYNPHIPFPIC